MKGKLKMFAISLLVGMVLFYTVSCKKPDPQIFAGTYIGTLTYLNLDSVGNAIVADTFKATVLSGAKDISISNGWITVSGKVTGNNVELSQSSSNGTITTGFASLKGDTLTLSGIKPTYLGNETYTFVGVR